MSVREKVSNTNTHYIFTSSLSVKVPQWLVCGLECGNISFVMNYVVFYFALIVNIFVVLCTMEVTKRIMLHSELNSTAVIAADVLFVFKKVIFAALHLLHI